MPLLDHFHPPVHPRHSWEGFHARWIVALTDQLNETLPADRFLAESRVHVGTHFEADVAEFELGPPPGLVEGNGAKKGGVALHTAVYAPPAPAQTVPMIFPSEYSVEVFDLQRDRNLVAVIELVSPANKDRPDTRRAFASKCSAYLQHGIGLIVVDIVTDRSGSLHRELLTLLGQPTDVAENDLYAVAYRPAHRDSCNVLDIWPEGLILNGPLPRLPLALKSTMFIPVDLEASYSEARQRSRL